MADSRFFIKISPFSRQENRNLSSILALKTPPPRQALDASQTDRSFTKHNKVLPPIRLQVRMILVAPRRSRYHHHHHHHHHYHDDRKYDTKFTRILYIYTHTKGSCKQSSTAVKPRNHIEAPLKNPFPTQDPSLPQPFTKLEENKNPPAQTHLSLLPPPLALVLNHSSQKKKGKHPPQKNPQKHKTKQNTKPNLKKRKLYKSIHKHVPLPPTSSIPLHNHSKRIERQRTIKP